VAATCHIGALDLEDTEQYIQHRLRLAGAKHKPQFEPGCYQVIYEGSKGIPRRINILCDRLLLQGFLAGRTNLTTTDAREVTEELMQESEAPKVTFNGFGHDDHRDGDTDSVAAPPSGLHVSSGTESHRSATNGLSRVKVDADAGERLSQELTSMLASGHGDRLQRLEATLQNIEQINLKTLSLLRDLVDAVRQSSERKDH